MGVGPLPAPAAIDDHAAVRERHRQAAALPEARRERGRGARKRLDPHRECRCPADDMRAGRPQRRRQPRRAPRPCHLHLRPLAAVSVHERLGPRADRDRHLDQVVPVAVVPPLMIARVKRVVGGADVGLDAVYEVEPRHPLRLVAGQPVDRPHEAAAVAGRDVCAAAQASSADWSGAARAVVRVVCPNPWVMVTIAARGPLGGVATPEPQPATAVAVRTRPSRERAPISCATGLPRQASPAPGRCLPSRIGR